MKISDLLKYPFLGDVLVTYNKIKDILNNPESEISVFTIDDLVIPQKLEHELFDNEEKWEQLHKLYNETRKKYLDEVSEVVEAYDLDIYEFRPSEDKLILKAKPISISNKEIMKNFKNEIKEIEFLLKSDRPIEDLKDTYSGWNVNAKHDLNNFEINKQIRENSQELLRPQLPPLYVKYRKMWDKIIKELT